MKKKLSNALVPPLLAFTSVVLASSAANAASMTFDASPFTGSLAKVNLTLDDQVAGAGKVQFRVDVDNSVSVADIRGIFFNVLDESLLGGLSIQGREVTQVVQDANSVIDLGSGNNLNGGKPFDVGVEIGEPGLKGGQDDFQTTTFTVSHTGKALSIADFVPKSSDLQSNQVLFGVRLQSVGTAQSREGSSKLVSMLEPDKQEVPEPISTAALGLFVAGAFGFLKKKTQEVEPN